MCETARADRRRKLGKFIVASRDINFSRTLVIRSSISNEQLYARFNALRASSWSFRIREPGDSLEFGTRQNKLFKIMAKVWRGGFIIIGDRARIYVQRWRRAFANALTSPMSRGHASLPTARASGVPARYLHFYLRDFICGSDAPLLVVDTVLFFYFPFLSWNYGDYIRRDMDLCERRPRVQLWLFVNNIF